MILNMKTEVTILKWLWIEAGVFYNVKNGSSLLRPQVHQKISVIKTNTFDDIRKIVHFGILVH